MGRMRQIGRMGIWDVNSFRTGTVPYPHPSHLSYPSHICPIRAFGAKTSSLRAPYLLTAGRFSLLITYPMAVAYNPLREK